MSGGVCAGDHRGKSTVRVHVLTGQSSNELLNERHQVHDPGGIVRGRLDLGQLAFELPQHGVDVRDGVVVRHGTPPARLIERPLLRILRSRAALDKRLLLPTVMIRCMNLTRVLFLASTLAVTLAVTRASPVTAECDGPYPDFNEVVQTAKTIVIGEVVALERGGARDPIDQGVSSRFTLQVVHVLRGSSNEVVTIADMPTQPCAAVIGARFGDRIALAVDGVAFTTRVKANMVAWIDAVPPPGFGPGSMSQAETYSVAEVFALVGQEVPPTATAAPAEIRESAPPSPLVPMLAAAVAIGTVVVIAMAIRRCSTDASG